MSVGTPISLHFPITFDNNSSEDLLRTVENNINLKIDQAVANIVNHMQIDVCKICHSSINSK